MIEHRCVHGHVTFSTNPETIVCSACKANSYAVQLTPKTIFSPTQKVVLVIPKEDNRFFCVCGKSKTKNAKHCLSCAVALRKKPPKDFKNQFTKKYNAPDWVSLTKMKIGLAEKNIARWKNMIAQHERMIKEKRLEKSGLLEGNSKQIHSNPSE